MHDKRDRLARWRAGAERLNSEFGRNTIMHCAILSGRQFAVTPGALKACCSATHEKGTPTICEYQQPDVDPEQFYSGLAEIIRGNQTSDGPCVGCRHLVQTKLPKHFMARSFSVISLHDFSGCNSACVYCAGSEYNMPVNFVASQDHEILFKNLLSDGLIRPRFTRVDWGGGEPTLVDTFDRTVEFLCSNRILETVNTSAVRFSPQVKTALQRRMAMVRVSTDSGTNETYAKVKRNKSCDAVWESVERYAATGGNLVVKYIIMSLNSDRDEIEAFVERCHTAGVKRICISADTRAAWHDDTEGGLTPKELEAAALMFNLARARHMHPFFEISIWQAAQLAEIGRIGGFNPNSARALAARALNKAQRIIRGTA